MSQNARILQALERGPVNPADFQAPTRDGGPPILRVAARIQDLKAQGHEIMSERHVNGTSTYFLVSDAERSVDTRPTPPPSREPAIPPPAVDAPLSITGLFDADEFRKRPGFSDLVS